MQIQIELAAKNYILKKSNGNAITLGVGKRDGASCGCSVAGGVYPTVKIGVSPFDIDLYNKLVIDDIQVFFPDTVPNTFKSVTVKVEGFLFYKQLLALGA